MKILSLNLLPHVLCKLVYPERNFLVIFGYSHASAIRIMCSCALCRAPSAPLTRPFTPRRGETHEARRGPGEDLRGEEKGGIEEEREEEERVRPTAIGEVPPEFNEIQ